MKRYKSNYVNPAGDKFPIVASSPCYDTYPPGSLFDQLADSGFTAILQDRTYKLEVPGHPDFDPNHPNQDYTGSNYTVIDRLLNGIKESKHPEFPIILGASQLYNKNMLHLDSNGLGTILLTEIDKLKTTALVTRYNKVENIKMWDIADEPGPEYFQLVKAYVDIIRKVSSKPVFINLSFSDSKTVEDFIKTVNPDFLSFDYYPIDESCEKFVHDDSLYQCLAVFSKAAKKHQIPFWTTSLAMGYINSSRLPCPDATEEYLRFEAFSALAYGAQGISYWRYSRPYNSRNESYSSALIDDKRKVTPQWYYVKKVNTEIQKYAYIFLACDAVPVHAAPESFFEKAPEVERITYPFGPIKYLWYDGLGVLISKITKGSDNYIIIVNHSPFNFQKVSFYPNIPIYEIEFVNSPYKFAIAQLASEKGASDESEIPAKRLVELGPYLEFTLPPGGYQIIKYP